METYQQKISNLNREITVLKRQLAMKRDPSAHIMGSKVLSAVQIYGDEPFTLSDVRYQLANDDVVSDKMIGSALLFAGYGKIRLTIAPGTRVWHYVKVVD